MIKGHPKIIIAQFKAVLIKIINTHPSESIHFREFLEVLSQNDIRVYSKTEILKISKFFNNPLKISRIQIPLSFLQLDNVQKLGDKKYFMVKVLFSQANPQLQKQKSNSHNKHECIVALAQCLKKQHGNQTNWFRALGGQSISITIDNQVFKKNLNQILQNSTHSHCISNILPIFLQYPYKKDVQWKKFIKTINKYHVVNSNILNKTRRFSFFQSITKHLPSKIYCDYYEHKTSVDSSTHRDVHSISLQKKKSILNIEFGVPNKQQKELSKIFSLSAKKCQIYNKRQQHSFIPKTNRQVKSSLTRRQFHRRIKTQQNYPCMTAKKEMYVHADTNIDQLKINLSSQSNQMEVNNSVLAPVTKDRLKKPKKQGYVVLLDSQAGLPIEI